MSVKSVRPVCAESNPVHSDPGTSARDHFAVNRSAGLSFSPSPEWLWSRITQGCFPTSTESKVRVLAGNLSALDTCAAVGAYAREIQSYGTVNRDLDDWKGKEKSFKQNLAKDKKELDENDSGYQDIKHHEKEDEDKLEGLKGDWDKNVASYRAQVLREVLKKTGDGAQVIVNKPGHFMKLHSIETSGLRMDDPWTPGKRHLVSWSDAYKQGYFRSYIVLTR
jgi:hypothetical protein